MSRRVTVQEIAAELGLDFTGVHAKARQMGLGIRKQVYDSRRHCTLSREDAERLRESYASTDPDITHWVDATTAARMLGLNTAEAFTARLARGSIQVERRQRVGPGVVGRQVRYNPADLRREAARVPVCPRSVPRGAVRSPELARIAGVGHTTLERWAEQGCPHGTLRNGSRYWYAPQVLAWLERQEVAPATAHLHRAGRERQLERLRQHLAQQPGRAA